MAPAVFKKTALNVTPAFPKHSLKMSTATMRLTVSLWGNGNAGIATAMFRTGKYAVSMRHLYDSALSGFNK